MSELKVEVVRREGMSLILSISLPEGVPPEAVEDAFFHGPLANELVQYNKSIRRMDDGTIRLRCSPNYLSGSGGREEEKGKLDGDVAYELGFQLRNYATT